MAKDHSPTKPHITGIGASIGLSHLEEDKARLLALELPRRIIDALAPHASDVRFCGGVVRDLMTGQLRWPNLDIDMASPMPPDQASAILKKAGLKVIPTGITHGTITVMKASDPALKVELTTLRADAEHDGRHAKVSYIDDWLADAERRDFTFNSLYMTASGDVFDPFDGLSDLEAGVVRFIGDPKDRLAEDYLRVFRYFRFYARFGKMPIDPQTATALSDALAHIDILSGERIASELEKIMQYQSLATITMMDNLGVWQALTGGQVWADHYADLLDLLVDDVGVIAGDETAQAILGLAVLMPADLCEGLAKRLKLSRKETQSLLRMATPLPAQQLDVLLSPNYRQECWRLCYRNSWSLADVMGAFINSVILRQTNLPAAKGLTGNDLRQQISRIAGAEWPAMPVNGNDIRDKLEAESAPYTGKQVGEILTALEDIWVEQEFVPNRRTLLTRLDAICAKD